MGQQVALALVERAGRRSLMLWSLAGTFVALLLLAQAFFLGAGLSTSPPPSATGNLENSEIVPEKREKMKPNSSTVIFYISSPPSSFLNRAHTGGRVLERECRVPLYDVR